MNRIAPWNVVHQCPRCDDGWVCENHPDKPWPSVCDCGAGMPCPAIPAQPPDIGSDVPGGGAI